MDYRQTPPIQWLPVFVAAADSLSFKVAAERMHVTPPAVSQQIKALEEWLGDKLFTRHARRLSLTPQGEFYFQEAQKVIAAHNQAYRAYQRRFKHNAVYVSAPLFIAQELLIPNYQSFNDFVADTELRIDARTSFIDFDSETVDAAIRFGDGHWPELNCLLLCPIELSPVCSAAYAKANPIHRLEDLQNQTLIYYAQDMSLWQRLFPFLEETRVKKVVCDSYLAVIKAATEGLGIAIGLLPTSNPWIIKHNLVLPFELKLSTPFGYWLVAPKAAANSASITGLFDWSKSLFDALPELANASAR